MSYVEDMRARSARHADTVISAVVAAAAVIALAVAGVRGLRLSATALLVGGASLAFLSSRRANRGRVSGMRLFLIYLVLTGVLWVIARAFGLE